jgi:hypothetical protein
MRATLAESGWLKLDYLEDCGEDGFSHKTNDVEDYRASMTSVAMAFVRRVHVAAKLSMGFRDH